MSNMPVYRMSTKYHLQKRHYLSRLYHIEDNSDLTPSESDHADLNGSCFDSGEMVLLVNT